MTIKHPRRIFRLVALGLCLGTSLMTAHDAYALRDSRPIPTDPRIRTILYNPNEVFKFVGHYGYQSSIEFAPDESILTISLGDSVSWMVTPTGNRLFLKPIEQDALTNMTVITNKRTYHFELHPEEADDINAPDMVFEMRFVYGPDDIGHYNGNKLDPVPLPDIQEHPEKYNFNYTIRGAEDIAPIRIFDDGEFTYFEFRDKNAEVPAFFLVDSKNEEAIINFRTRGDYIAVERVARRFTLRHGADIVCVYNEALIGKSPQIPAK